MAFRAHAMLNDGDIISIDIGAQYEGYHGDSAWTYPVSGSISEEHETIAGSD